MSKSTQEKIAGPLRLATKYEKDDLRSHLIEILLHDWPQSLNAWDKYQKVLEQDMVENDAYFFPPWYPDPGMIIFDALRSLRLMPTLLYRQLRLYTWVKT